MSNKTVNGVIVISAELLLGPLSLNTLVNDVDKRFLYAFHRLPRMSEKLVQNEFNGIKRCEYKELNEKERNGILEGILDEIFDSTRKKPKYLSKYDISREILEEVKNDSVVSKCHLLSNKIEKSINGDPVRRQRKLCECLERRLILYILATSIGYDDIVFCNLDFFDIDEKEIKLDEYMAMLLECYSERASAMNNILRVAEGYGIKVMISIDGDPAIDRVFKTLLPGTDTIVFPRVEDNKSTFYSDLKGKLASQFSNPELECLIIDNDIRNTDIALTAGWDVSSCFHSSNDESWNERIIQLIDKFAIDYKFSPITFCGKVHTLTRRFSPKK